MKLHEKIKSIRQSKGWSQQEVAKKLNMSLNAYGHIERGKSHPNSIKLEKIAQAFEIDLAELVSDRNIFIFGGTYGGNHCQSSYNNSSPEQLLKLQHELEKAQLINAQQTKEIEYLKQQISDLREMTKLIKKSET